MECLPDAIDPDPEEEDRAVERLYDI
ncbi:uncharacterized protein G2W53_037423 [Senna tora]|uniref:Uncharacterized protein n=1 Tax=Senna tora TaxID=362788 RepID=A0A834W5N0_9FABA|nr:uncharacterized protein G2W53_037366 [Senna tora]KAF7810680.1 uncharacterized protein G2W53_037423 [Senna tora]